MISSLSLGTCALGRAIDSTGAPLDGGPPLMGRRVALVRAAPLPHERAPVERPFWTGVRAVDGLLAFGRGARIGIFGAPGSGKSTLLESLVAGCSADAVIVGLCGERGREAQRWIERRDARTTIVCATSDRAASERIACVEVAFAHAAALRDRGLHVAFVLDSLARCAAALRERATERGEIAGRGGYPPSVFAQLARFVEVAGPLRAGSITLIATVLSDGDDRDPVSDAARSLLDGHLQLSPRLAAAGRFPAVDVPASASRTMDAVATAAHRRHAAVVRGAVALLDRIDDARALGIIPEGTAGRILEAEPQLEAFLRQGDRPSAPAATLAALAELADTLEGPIWT
ncbi:MAG TPA: EscN/YscN/HrcN family type III secretion system ATPase [Candidatus Acidoferrales bacterium]|jgi:type III secretion protein N (ATPase)|nr:EscN/YscN/HrcN family type III secretion system ATPase [Candidatus Acidoferrales bacterium]